VHKCTVQTQYMYGDTVHLSGVPYRETPVLHAEIRGLRAQLEAEKLWHQDREAQGAPERAYVAGLPQDRSIARHPPAYVAGQGRDLDEDQEYDLRFILLAFVIRRDSERTGVYHTIDASLIRVFVIRRDSERTGVSHTIDASLIARSRYGGPSTPPWPVSPPRLRDRVSQRFGVSDDVHAPYGQTQRCNHAKYYRIYSMMYSVLAPVDILPVRYTLCAMRG
jgi:hypothetical protein